MPLSAGTRFGHYEIVAPLGAGGMGEVYRARDVRLGRDVALKVMTEARAADEESRRRFEREARVISSLSHPNICPLYDVGGEGDLQFLVMELLEGRTLAERIAAGQMPLAEIARTGSEIASALAAAHARGILHRDLKPGNVMLTRTGVRLLDFGLARTLATPGAGDASSQRTRSMDLTDTGTLLGTVHYMSPEEIEGRPADARSDIFALGAVLHEMATGRRAFTGDSPASILSSILRDAPPAPSLLRPGLPPAFDRLVRLCLARDPDARLQSANDIALQLREMSASGETRDESRRTRRPAIAWPWAVVTAVAVVVAVTALVRSRTPAASVAHTRNQAAIRFEIPPPEGGQFAYTRQGQYLGVAPDGRTIAFLAVDSAGTRRVWLRSLDDPKPTPLPNTDGASSLMWSPDGREICFFADRRLKRVDLKGGPAVTVCETPASGGMAGSWGKKGDILFSSAQGEAIYAVPAEGGSPEPIVQVGDGVIRVQWPWYLPDGVHFLYSAWREGGRDSLVVAARSEPARGLVSAGSQVQYREPGELVYVRDGQLLSQPFDWKNGTVHGGPVPIVGDVRFFGATGAASFALSETGTLVYSTHRDRGRMAWFDRSGHEQEQIGPIGEYFLWDMNPGMPILFSRREPQTATFDVWSYDPVRRVEQRLTPWDDTDIGAQWVADGRAIVYSRTEGGPPRLYQRDLDLQTEVPLLPAGGFQLAVDVSPDGRTLLYWTRDPDGRGLWTMPLDRSGTPRRLPASDHAADGRFSPDGRYVAMLSNESGRYEVYVRPFPDPGRSVPVSSDGAVLLSWPARSSELFYVTPDDRVVAVEVATAPGLRVGEPRTLFRIGEARSWNSFAGAPDGRRILAAFVTEAGSEKPLTVELPGR